MKGAISLVVSASMLAATFVGCGANTKENSESLFQNVSPETIVASQESKTEETVESVTVTETMESVASQKEINFEVSKMVDPDMAYQPLELHPNVPSYSVSPDLTNIKNLDQFTNLSAAQRNMIAQNGFVVIPTDEEQLFYVYEENTYKKIPNFITVDSVLQLYHIYYDYILRNVEQDSFYDQSIQMNQLMINELEKEFDSAQNEEVREAIQLWIGYFAVANSLLGKPLPASLTPETKQLVEAELAYIKDASSVEFSPLLGVRTDYSLFKIRGHYTRTDELGKYFEAFSWYGVSALPLDEPANHVKAMVLGDALVNCEGAREIWDTIYAITGFMVGESDDITPVEIAKLVNDLFGEIPVPDRLVEKKAEFAEEVNNFRNPMIVNKRIDKSEEQGLQLRFMGQRYIPDSDILQKLCDAEYRPMPSGLDVLAVYGSERAEALLNEIYNPSSLWNKYPEKYQEACDIFRNQSLEEQTKNIYSGWLFGINELATTKKDGYPMFMQNDAWMNKSVNTALASWSELRHDTILYGKQSGAECGGDCDFPEIIAYVEPDAEFFHRLVWLTKTTQAGLEKRGLFEGVVQYKTETILEELEFLESCATKELAGQDLSAEECLSLLCYGGTLEYISSSIADVSDWYLIENETDRHMAVIADVHRAYSTYLEEAVGNACAIYVAIPYNGDVYLTRGAVFDYYEFYSDTRYTDEEWQKQLQQSPPPRMPYTNTYMTPEKESELAIPDYPFSTGC